MKRSDFSTELKDFPAIEAVDISNYLVLQTYFDSGKHRNVRKHYTLHKHRHLR